MHRRCKPELRQNFQSASGIRICHWWQIRWTRSREGRAMWLSPALLLLSLSGEWGWGMTGAGQEAEGICPSTSREMRGGFVKSFNKGALGTDIVCFGA